MSQELTPEEIVERIARCDRPIEFATSAGRAFTIIAQLQLALRHPENVGESSVVALEIIENLTMAIAEVTETPEVATLVQAGFNPTFDR